MPTKEVLRTGTFTDSSGKKVTITDHDLEQLANNFNSEKSVNSEGQRVPLFLGHPADESTAPAHGWIKRIFAKDGILHAEFDKLTESAEKAIKEFSFRDVSVSIWKNILQHIGLTNTPAVPGLADFQFKNAHKDDAQILTFSESTTTNKGGKMPSELEVKLTSDNKDLETKLSASEKVIEENAEAITNLTAERDSLKDENSELAKVSKENADELAKLHKEIEEKAIAEELKSDTEFVDNLCSEKKLAPADREATIAKLTKYPTDEIEENKSAKDLYKEALLSAGQKIDDGEKFNDGEEKVSDKESKLEKLTKEYQEKHSCDHNFALAKVLDENPKLNTEG